MTVLLTIGEFAQMTHLSVKALRHYHDVGVLAPEAVDPVNGYRRYGADQIPAAHLIRRLRDLEMPLDDIRSVLVAPDIPARDAAIAAHLERMERRLDETRTAVASLRALLGGSPTPLVIEYRSVPAIGALAVRGEVGMDDCMEWLTAAYIDLHVASVSGGGGLSAVTEALYPAEFFGQESAEITAYVPFSGDVPRGAPARVEPIVVPAAELAVALHVGPFDDLDRTYGELGRVVAERALAGPGPIRERYLVTAADDPDPSAMRSEVCWPLSHKPSTEEDLP